MRVLWAVLTSRDRGRLERALESALQANVPRADQVVVVNTQDEAYREEALKAASARGVVSIATDSNGRPGRGKNSVLDVFLDHFPEHSHVFQIDGDDHLHANARRAVYRDLRLDPEALLIAYQIVDRHDTRQYWRDGLGWPEGRRYGPGESTVFAEARPTCFWMPRLFSRAGCALLRFDEGLQVAEDHLLMLQATQLHRRAVGRVWVSRSSDVYCIDWTGEGVQATTPEHDWGPLLAELWDGVRRRTSPWELPVMWSDPCASVAAKDAHCGALDAAVGL